MKKDELNVELSFDWYGLEIRNCRRQVKMNLKDFKSIHYTQLSKIERWVANISIEQVRSIFQEMFPGKTIEISFR